MAAEQVWKYKLPTRRDLRLLVPKGAELLGVDVVGNEYVLWARTEFDYQDTEVRYFEMVATGRPIPQGHPAYVGTIVDTGAVWHVFETDGPPKMDRNHKVTDD
jgi:hypothetical protein